MHSALIHLNQNQDQDLFWNFSDIDNLIPKHVHQVTEEFNQTGFHNLLNPLRSLAQEDKATGLEYALLENYGDSKRTAVVHFNPFANGLSDNMLLRAAFLKKVFDSFEIKDKREDLLPMLTFSAPSGSRNIKLEKQHHRRISAGNFDDLSQHYLSIVQKLGYKEIAIIGFSQGASMAVATAALASEFNIKVTHLAVGEPANIMDRPKRVLMRRFAASAKHLKPSVEATGLQPLKQAHEQESAIRYVLGIARQSRLNMNLLRGLSTASFAEDLEKSVSRDCLITIGYGGVTSISPPRSMQKIIAEVRKNNNYKSHGLHSVEIKGAHHAWADQLHLLALFYAYGISR